MREFCRSFDLATMLAGMIAFGVLYGGIAAALVWLALAVFGPTPNPPITAGVVVFGLVTAVGGLYGGSERYRTLRRFQQAQAR